MAVVIYTFIDPSMIEHIDVEIPEDEFIRRENASRIFAEETCRMARKEIAAYDEQFAELLDSHAAEKARHAQKRKDDFRVIARKRAAHTCHKGSGNWNPRPWWDKADEDGIYRKPRLGAKHSGNVQHGPQLHRWSKYAPSSKKNTWKKAYDSREIEKINKFAKIDARAERMDRFSDDEIEDLWNERTGNGIRDRRNELIGKRAELIKERDEIREKYGDILDRYGELNYGISDLDSEIYYLD